MTKSTYCTAMLAALIPLGLSAHDEDLDSVATPTIHLHEVTVAPRIKHLNEAARLDVTINPVRSSQEVLRVVPGLFIAQHAGGGKAEQLFLRGFDLDHGTDINISVDGMPVNMVSHAHGQGYADLHFLQPELIDHVDFDKGPYDASKGNLATAGYVAFKTKDRVQSEAGVEIGTHNYQRYHSTVSLINKPEQSFYVSAAYLSDDGFFDADQNFKRINLFTKYTRWGEASRFSVIASHFNSNWNASGQIPERAVNNGMIGWFGSLDPSEGGSTSRTNAQFLHHLHLTDRSYLSTNVYASYYTFNLFSNFTFLLNDRENGDEINQKEKRFIGGGNTEYTQSFDIRDNEAKWAGGVGFRYDNIKDLALYHAAQRHQLGTYSLGDAGESNMWAYASAEFNFGNWLINPGVRVDQFHFDYIDRTAAEFTNPNTSKFLFSPKLNIMYSPLSNLDLILKVGKGFHSNDTRVAVIRNGKDVVPAAYGVDFGVKYKPVKGLLLSATGWFLYSDQEFVYVGDEAVVEPSGKSRRFGFDLGVRYEFLRDFYFQCDYTYSHARAFEEPKGEDYIPLAPVNTLVAGLSWHHKGFAADIKGRWLGNRPANEDYSLTAKGYFITDLNFSYTYSKFTFGAAIDNLFDVKWKEAQFATETFIPGDKEPITDICFTPGTPFAIRGFVTFKF